MQLKSEFLLVGSIVEYNIGSDIDQEWQATVLDWQDIKWLSEEPQFFNIVHRGIPLTEKILIEWCNMKKTENVDFELGKFVVVACGIRLPQDEWEFRYKDTVIDYLHELQMAYLVHMKIPLPIQIK